MAEFRYPKLNVGNSPKSMDAYVKFTIYEREDRLQSNPVSTIFLFMPERVQSPSTVSWNPMELGSVMGPADRAMRMNMDSLLGTQGMEGISKAAAGAAGNLANQGMQKLYENSKIAQTLTGVPYETFAAGAGSIAGVIQNPYLSMIFKGVNLRTFEFEFKLFPHSVSEAKEIKNIIKEFRRCSLPPGSGDGALGFWLGYPMEFSIEYVFDGQPNPHLNKFKRSVLTAISSDYTGGGMWSMTRDGFPTETVLSLRFQELSIVLRDDVEGGGY